MSISAIITAGGQSTRFGNNKNKLLEKINNKEIIKYTVDAFILPEIEEIIIPTNQDFIELFKKIFYTYNNIKIISGGSSRQESIYNALQYIKTDYVLIHDGARPLVKQSLIKKIIEEIPSKKSLIPMTKTTDTIKEVNPQTKEIIRTPDRTFLYNTQTPQAFSTDIIKEAHEKFKGQNYTDDAGMVETLGYKVFMTEGDYTNIKITTQTDLDIAKTYLY